MMAITRTLPPEHWAEIAGVWIHITALNDPLLRQDLHRVDVHRDERGHAWITVSGANAGVRVQSTPPAEGDLP